MVERKIREDAFASVGPLQNGRLRFLFLLFLEMTASLSVRVLARRRGAVGISITVAPELVCANLSENVRVAQAREQSRPGGGCTVCRVHERIVVGSSILCNPTA